MKTFYFIIFILFVLPWQGMAQWDGNMATVYNPVSTTYANEQYAYTVTDGAGGIIAVWSVSDFANDAAGVYCQHKTAEGVITWGDSSTPVLLANNFPDYSSISVVDVKPDDSGGAYITWNMRTNDVAEVYLQHINQNGIKTFTQSGIKITPVMGSFAYGGKMCADAAGVFVSWSEQVQDGDSLHPSYAEVMIQRYSKQGVAQWGTGVPVSTVSSLRAVGQLVSDGNGGLFVAYLDARNSNFDQDGNADNLDIYAQHISSSGALLWGAQDIPVTTEIYNQQTIDDGGSEIFSSIITDSAGGFILVYNNQSLDNSLNAKLYAQRINGSGTALWAAGGIELYDPFPASYSKLTQVVSDGASGLVVSWDVNYYSGFGDVYAQRVTPNGEVAWGASGKKINPASPGGGFNDQGTLIADGAGAYIVAWSNRLEFAVKAQKINNAGQLLWDTAGVYICTNPYSVPSQPILSTSDSSTVIAVWGDQRNSFTDNASDLYAAKVDSNGNLVQSGPYISVANGNWDVPATWMSNSVPPYGADVIVRHNVISNIDAACKSLRVEFPGSLTVNAGINITILQ